MTTSGMWRPAWLHFWAVTGWMFPCQTPRSRYIHSFPVHMSSNQTTWLYDVIDSKHWAAIPPLPSRHALLPSYMGAHGHFSLKPTKCFGTALGTSDLGMAATEHPKDQAGLDRPSHKRYGWGFLVGTVVLGSHHGTKLQIDLVLDWSKRMLTNMKIFCMHPRCSLPMPTELFPLN
jgi:hypothetical protein